MKSIYLSRRPGFRSWNHIINEELSHEIQEYSTVFV